MKQIFLSIAALLHLLTHTNTPSAEYMKLLPLVTNADVAAVQAELAASPLTRDEAAKLIQIAHIEKNQVTLEIAALGTKKMRWGLLGKGFLQMLAAGYCLFNTGATVWSGVNTAARDRDNVINPPLVAEDQVILPSYVNIPPVLETKMDYVKNILTFLLHPALGLYKDMYESVDPDQRNYVTATVIPIATLLFLAAATEMCRKSTKNLKAGWNYRAILEKKIAQFDEIITYLETHNSTIIN